MYYDLLYKEAVKKLQSKNNDVVVEGIRMMRDAGKLQTVRDIIGILSETKDEEVVNECAKFLMDLKDQKTSDIIIEAIKNPDYQHILPTLTSVCWQSRLDFSDHLDTFIDIVLTEDFRTAYEAFTVVENNASQVSEMEINKNITNLKENAGDVNEEKKLMVIELISTLEDIKAQGE